MRGDNEAKARYVNEMFARIARRYDFMNRLMSLGRDRAWRRALIKAANPPNPGRVLDVGTGTADLAIELAGGADSVVALDFCPEMMSLGRYKVSKKGVQHKIEFILGDAAALPFADDSFDCALAGFVLRNMADMPRCLAEISRILKPNGCIALLELVMPPSRLVRAFHHLYLWWLTPIIGRVVTGNGNAYAYLPRSIADFPKAQEMKGVLERIGFRNVSYRPLNLGAIAIYTGLK